MRRLELPIDPPGLIDISAQGDLVVQGHTRDLVEVLGEQDEGEVRVERDAGALRIHAPGDASLRVPRGARLVARCGGDLAIREFDTGVTIKVAAGDLLLESVRGDVVVGEAAGDVVLLRVGGAADCGSVGGDLRLDACQDARVGTVGGDLSAQAIGGALVADAIGGGAALEGCRGHVALGRVGARLRARDLTGGLDAPSVGGALRLHTAFAPGTAYAVRCDDDARVTLAGDPATASVSFDLRADDGEPELELPLEGVAREGRRATGRLGAGEATVRVASGGRLRLGASTPEPGLDAAFGGLFEGLEEGRRVAFSWFTAGGERHGPDLDDIGRRAEEAARHAAEKVERKAARMAERMAEHAQRAAERTRRAAERAARHGDPSRWRWRMRVPEDVAPRAPEAAAPAAPPPPRVTEEERLVVLRMLREGTIGVDDATRLLAALAE